MMTTNDRCDDILRMVDIKSTEDLDEFLNLTAAVVETVGYCFSKKKQGLRSVSDVVNVFNAYCASESFTSYLASVGLKNARFGGNPYLINGCPAADKFQSGMHALEDGAVLGLAFHGTSRGNIQPILQYGLNKNLRKGQAYGPGEYFSKEPGVSVSFCKGGLAMLVFAVVVPTTAKRGNCPPDYVIVENNHHQLPIGTILFQAVEQKVLKQSQQRRNNFVNLRRKLNQQAVAAKEALLKSTIIQHLIGNKIDLASDLYQRKANCLNQISKREISMYVHRFVDEEIIFFLFPNLPYPMCAQDRDKANIASVDKINQTVAKLFCDIGRAEEALLKHQSTVQASSPVQSKSTATNATGSNKQATPASSGVTSPQRSDSPGREARVKKGVNRFDRRKMHFKLEAMAIHRHVGDGEKQAPSESQPDVQDDEVAKATGVSEEPYRLYVPKEKLVTVSEEPVVLYVPKEKLAQLLNNK